MFGQIAAADFPFGEPRAESLAARGDDARSQLTAVQIESMVKPRFQYRRGAAPILSSSQDNNRVSRLGFVDSRLPPDLIEDECKSHKAGQ